jgi:hypothetical protein
MAGVSLAAGVVEHQYFLTEKKLTLPPDLTTLRDPDNNFYLKPDTGSFAIGGWEDGTKGCWRGKPPLDFGRELFEPNWDRLELFALPTASVSRPERDRHPDRHQRPDPGVASTASRSWGWPRNSTISRRLRLHRRHRGLWRRGPRTLEPYPPRRCRHGSLALRRRRFGAVHAQGRYLEQRAIEAYGAYYKVHWPGEEAQALRGLRRSPLHAQARDERRRLRFEVRLGAAQLVFDRGFTGEGPPLLRGKDRTGSMPSGKR